VSPADPLNFVIEHPGRCPDCGGPTCPRWPVVGAVVHCGAGHRAGGTDCGWLMDLPPIPPGTTGVTVVATYDDREEDA
jgi:hypothetical protein